MTKHPSRQTFHALHSEKMKFQQALQDLFKITVYKRNGTCFSNGHHVGVTICFISKLDLLNKYAWLNANIIENRNQGRLLHGKKQK
jgi:hypothetical protein